MERGDLSGAVLDGRYRVIEPVAQGGMGTVYRAERIKLGRVVAIKVLHEVLPHELAARKRFEIEAMAMAKLEHPHCASVQDVGVHNDRPFVVMDFVSGQNLKDVITAGPMPIARAAEIVRQVLSGLAHAHELGIIHRDIKPANLVLSQKAGLGDHVKILDFGLARLHDTGQNLTTGVVVGTPAYMAPEQIRGQQLDFRADLYACGVLLFELLTGAKPFHSEADDPIEVCRLHLSAPIPRLEDKLPGMAFGELEAVAARALAKHREDRFASAQEFAAALEAAAGLAPRQRLSSQPSGPIELGSRDMLAAGDASYPPAAEVRTGDVLTELADRPSSTPPAGTRAVPPTATDDTVAAGRAGVAGRAGGAGAANRAGGAEIANEEASAPGTFLGLSVRASSQVPRVPRAATGESSQARSEPGRAAPRRRRRRTAMLVGLALVAAIAGGVVIASRDSSTEPAAIGSASAGSGSAAEPDPIRDIIARANDLAARDANAALDVLHRARGQYPDNAALAYTAGRICFSKYYWTEGLKHFRDAIRSQPSYRTDPELIKTVLRGFNVTPSYNPDLAGFLHDDIGSAAQPFLEETARDHPNQTIRNRAAAELRRYH